MKAVMVATNKHNETAPPIASYSSGSVVKNNG
jgi:hypothetical protein